MKKNLFVFLMVLTVQAAFSQGTINATALKSGCRIVSSPPSYYVSNPHTIKIDSWTVQGLLDETRTTGWCSAQRASFPMIFVFELSEEFLLSDFVFKNECQKEYPGICAKQVKVELSTTSSDKGFLEAGIFILKEYSTTTVSISTAKARWIRLTVLSNYGNREYTQLMEFEAKGVYAEYGYNASNIVGVWETNFNWVSINNNENKYIYGCYKWSQGELYAGTVHRRVFNFRWTQKGDGQKGWATVVINKEGTRLSGIWGYNDNYSQFGFWDFSKKTNIPNECWNDQSSKKLLPDYTLQTVSDPVAKKETVNLKVKLVDAADSSAIEGKVRVLNHEDILGEWNTAGKNYSLETPQGLSLTVTGEADGYMSAVEKIETISQHEIKVVLKLVKLEVGKAVVLESIRFEQSKFQLLQESFTELDKIVRMMKDYPSMEIELSGHTDNQGDVQKNIELSENRVKAVKNYLISKGIKAGRMVGVGYGGAKPVASNKEEETRKLNRRVEFKIIKF